MSSMDKPLLRESDVDIELASPANGYTAPVFPSSSPSGNSDPLSVIQTLPGTPLFPPIPDGVINEVYGDIAGM